MTDLSNAKPGIKIPDIVCMVAMDFQAVKDDLDLSKKKKVGNYLLGKTLGEGSFAKVREGIHIIAREKVAVKVVSKRALVLRDFVKRRVRREVVMLQRLEHPNIIRMYEIMETENCYYLVLEMAYSGDFVSYLADKRCLGEVECRRYIRQMSSALDHMHTSNIVHRDLKLENLLLDKNSNLKIIDFGSSNVFFGECSLSTQCGSPVYAAPEMFSGNMYGPAVDVWSMGVCLYAMLTGKLPFNPSPTANLPDLHKLIMNGVDIPNYLSEGCCQLLTGMLTVDAQYRMEIGDILVHRWITETYDDPLLTRQPPLGKLFPNVPNNFIVNYMTKMFNFQEDDIFYSVLERKMNAVAATYQLLSKRFESGQNLVGIPTIGQRVQPVYSEDFRDHNHRQKRDGPMQMNGELPAISREPSSLIGPKTSVNLFKYSSSKYSEYKPRDIIRSLSVKRRNKMRIGKNTKTEEEISGVPDFILSYAHNDKIDYEIPDKRYEWEPSFIVTKHGSTKSAKTNHSEQSINNTKANQKHTNTLSHKITENNGNNMPTLRDITPFGRGHFNTPTNSIADEDIFHTKSISGDTTISDKASTVLSGDDSNNDRTWSSYHRQKSRLARGMSLTVKREHSAAYNYKAPFSAPKALSPMEAKSYFQEIANARVVGSGRSLLQRTLSKAEDFRYSAGRSFKPKTAPLGRGLSMIPSPDLTVDSHGILQFPLVLRGTPTPTPRSPPPRHTLANDGVRDIIKVQITSATKR